MTKLDFLQKAKQAAMNIGQQWPGYVAAEAALESAYGASKLAAEDNNLFGMKQHVHPEFGTVNLPTREFLHEAWVVVEAPFVKYPDWEACLRDRLNTLMRLAPHYPHYANALAAGDGVTFVREVSATWSTDPERGQKVLDIYNANLEVLG